MLKMALWGVSILAAIQAHAQDASAPVSTSRLHQLMAAAIKPSMSLHPMQGAEAAQANPNLHADIPLPDGPGKDTTQRLCGTRCHSTDIAAKQHHDADRWDAIIENMVSKGLEASDDDLQAVNDYLAAHFGPGSQSASTSAIAPTGPTPSQASSGQKSAQATPEESIAGDAAAGRGIFLQNCKSCHAVDQGQTGIGPNLWGVHDKQRPTEMRTIIENGKGKLPLQMPPFKDKLSPQDIDNLVAYLHTI